MKTPSFNPRDEIKSTIMLEMVWELVPSLCGTWFLNCSKQIYRGRGAYVKKYVLPKYRLDRVVFVQAGYILQL